MHLRDACVLLCNRRRHGAAVVLVASALAAACQRDAALPGRSPPAASHDSVPPPTPAPRRADGATAQTDVPSAPFHWTLAAFDGLMSGWDSSTRARSTPQQRPGDVPTALLVPGVPSARYSLQGTVVDAYVLGDPVVSLREARALQRTGHPEWVIFTSNNLLVVAYRSTEAIARLKAFLQSRTTRSGVY